MGKMATMMGGMNKKPQPRLHISAHVDNYGGEEPSDPYDDVKYLKKDLSRCQATQKKIQSELDTFIPEDVAAKVKKSLEEQLESEKLSEEETKMRIRHAKKKRARRDK